MARKKTNLQDKNVAENSAELGASELSALLSVFDTLSRKQQTAFIAWFSGGRTMITRYYSKEYPGVYMGKAECEWVDFDEVWLKLFPDLEWLTVEVEKTGIAIGMVGKPKYTEYRLYATKKGLDVKNAYWCRLQNR